MGKVLVLYSGGLDSTVLLHKLVKEKGKDNVIALDMFYGQKHKKEIECARYHCNRLGVKRISLDLSSVYKFSEDRGNRSALLVGSDQEISKKSYADQIKETGKVNAYVPFRNGLFLAYAAAIAEQLECDEIAYGAHADDAAGNAYPDCSESFIAGMRKAILTGTQRGIALLAPWAELSKTMVVKRGRDIGMSALDFENTWSCYVGETKPCGECGTCRDRALAFKNNGYNIL